MAATVAAPVIELGEFIVKCARDPAFALDSVTAHEMSKILTAIKLGAKVVNREICFQSSVSHLSDANITPSDDDKPMMANRKFLDALINREVVAGIATPMVDNIVVVPHCNDKRLVCLVHPLDGTRQIDVNVSVGTLFSIYYRVSPVGQPCELRDFLQPGCKQLCAGYVIYGSSTMLVFTMGHGVHGFTLDPSLGTFYLSHPHMSIPLDGTIYSVNGGKRRKFPQGVVEYIKHCQEKQYSCRYIGSMVADFHRNLLKGGIYIYPPTFADPKPSNSMVFQCFPLAFLCEQAGGKCSDGFTRILDIEPTTLYERVPFFCGSTNMVTMAESYMARKKMVDGGWCFRHVAPSAIMEGFCGGSRKPSKVGNVLVPKPGSVLSGSESVAPSVKSL